MNLCLFNYIFTKGNYMVKVVGKSANNIYVSKNDDNCVAFSNEINYYLNFPNNFSAKDLDLFFTICYYAKKAKNKVKMICIDFDEMDRFLDYNKALKNKKRFYNEICNCCIRCLNITSRLGSVDCDEFNPFFKSIVSNKVDKKVSFELNQVAFDYLNAFERYFKLDLKEYCSLRTKGAKILFRILVQFKNIEIKNGYKELVFSIDEFQNILKSGAIESNEVKFISSKVLDPAIKELVGNNYFNNIVYDKLKNEKINKKDVIGLKIAFDDSNRLQ